MKSWLHQYYTIIRPITSHQSMFGELVSRKRGLKCDNNKLQHRCITANPHQPTTKVRFLQYPPGFRLIS